MSIESKTWDAQGFSIIFGAHALRGFPEGTKIKIPVTAGWSKKVGVDGDFTRVKLHDKSAEIEVYINAASSMNDILSSIANQDDDPLTPAVYPFRLVDRFGTTLHTASKAYISKRPDVEIGQEPGANTWVITVADLKTRHGGSRNM